MRCPIYPHDTGLPLQLLLLLFPFVRHIAFTMTVRGGNDDPPMAVAVPITNSVSTSYAYAVPSVPPAAFDSAASAPAATTTTTSYTVPPPRASTPAPAPSILYGSLGRSSVAVQCPFCRAQTVTRTRNNIDGVTMIAVVVMCFLFWPLLWLPLCMPNCKSTNHFCTHCHQKIAKTDPCS
jgi:hypothetical protein